MQTIHHWVGGKSTSLFSSRSSTVYNPATGAPVADVVLAEVDDVDKTVETARAAFVSWSQVSISRRTTIMFKYRDLLDKNRLELAKMVSTEHGKVLADALGEVGRGIEVADYACGIGRLLQSPRSEDVSTAVDSYTVRQPLGVVAGITPFNFPVMVPMWMYPVAIACGNSSVSYTHLTLPTTPYV